MGIQGRVSISPDSVTFKGESFRKIEVTSLKYKEPNNWPMAIISNGAKYIYLMFLVVGIPIAIYNAYLDVNNHRIILQINRPGVNNKRDIVTWHVTVEEYEFLKNNY